MIERYSRQTAFLGDEAQTKIANAVVAIVGCGALGSSSAEIMCRAGVKKLILVDYDNVEESNLQRQSLYTENDLGVLKVEALKKHLILINSKIDIEIHAKMLELNNQDILKSDVIIDGTDNLKTRFIVNKYAANNNISFIFGSIIKAQGMVYASVGTPCFECIFLNSKDFETCENQGILASAAKIISSMQCAEAIKIITGKESCKELIKIDLWNNEFTKIKPKTNPECLVCNNHSKKTVDFEINECETKAMYRVKLKKRAHLNMKNLNGFEIVMDGGMIVIIKVEGEEIIVHDFGELIFKTLKNTDKIREISEVVYSRVL